MVQDFFEGANNSTPMVDDIRFHARRLESYQDGGARLKRKAKTVGLMEMGRPQQGEISAP